MRVQVNCVSRTSVSVRRRGETHSIEALVMIASLRDVVFFPSVVSDLAPRQQGASHCSLHVVLLCQRGVLSASNLAGVAAISGWRKRRRRLLEGK